jgi:two-component system sensor histidine kinase KdpD
LLDPRHVPLLILCGVVVGSLFLRAWGALVLAAACGLLWNFFFTEPLYSFRIDSASDVAMFTSLTVAGLAMGHLSNRLLRRERSVSRQQKHYSRLLEINTILTGSHDTGETVARCISAVTTLFQFPCAIQLRDDADQRLLPAHPASTLTLGGKERGVAEWTFEKRQPAGKGTGTLAEAAALHLPLQGRALVMGVLSVDPGERPIPLAERDQLASVAAQLGLALERNHLLRAIHRAEFLERGDQLRRSLLDHVSHELRTPVAVISTAIDALAAGARSDALLAEMRIARTRLRRVVDQLVESARVESGAVSPLPEWCDLLDLLETARDRADDLLAGHPLEIQLAAGTPPIVHVDGELLLTALGNLLANAGHHTPAGTSIHLHATVSDNSMLEIRVRDEGPGLENPDRVFDRFHRGTASRPGGLGLGLSIVRGIARGLGGDVRADNAPGGGAEFTLRLPVRTATEIPPTP